MGNGICGCRRRGAMGAVEERLTRPQRLVRQPSNVDYRKLRKLILSHKLAPCFDAHDDPNSDLEECPICFFYFPSLNRSRCCAKGICTECFLQMKPSSNGPRSAQCPFCKTSRYAIEYRGARTEEEKVLEQVEEQKVIEAKLRMQLQDSHHLAFALSTNESHPPLEVYFSRYSLEGLPNEPGFAVREDTVADCSPLPIGSLRHEELCANLEELMGQDLGSRASVILRP